MSNGHEPYGVSEPPQAVSPQSAVNFEALSAQSIDLAWKDICVHAGDTMLLDHVRGSITKGLIAIMGPSGSGKTTLLNCLASRLGPELTVAGELRINGEPYSQRQVKKFIGYVMQDDEHSPLLTPRETLRFITDARLGHKMSAAGREFRVNELLEQLHLMHVADVPVGSGNSGIAAGEKKRLSVAIELVTLPKILFLDEPTSNLDSLDALQFVQSLRRLVDQRGCVVVCTVHQPQYKVFSTFDRLILLRSGSIVYDDDVALVRAYCEKIDKPCPENVNPADHLMEAVAPSRNWSFNTDMRYKVKLLEYYGQPEVDIERGKGRRVAYLRERPPFLSMLRFSAARAITLLKRRRNEWITNLLINIINAVLVGTVFLQIGTSTSSVAKRNPALFFTIVNQATFGAISTVNLFPSERTVILRLRASGNLSALPYFLTMVVAEMLSKLLFPIIFVCITYPLIGFRPGADHFFKDLAAVIISFWTGMSISVMVSTISRRQAIASMTIPLIMEISRLFAGYFSPPSQQVPGLRWIDYLSYIFYGYTAVANNEMDGLMLHSCNATACTYSDAGNQLRANKLDLGYDKAVGIQVCYMIICLSIGYAALRFLKA